MSSDAILPGCAASANGLLATSAAPSATASAVGAAALSEAAAPEASATATQAALRLPLVGPPQSYIISAHDVYNFNGSYDERQVLDVGANGCVKRPISGNSTVANIAAETSAPLSSKALTPKQQDAEVHRLAHLYLRDRGAFSLSRQSAP